MPVLYSSTGRCNGQLTIDATLVVQAISYPIDLSLQNEVCQFSTQIIEVLYKSLKVAQRLRSYHQKDRSAYTAVAKQERFGAKILARTFYPET